jgi:hypothetical protein
MLKLYLREFTEKNLRELRYGHLKLVYKTYWHSFEQKEIVLYAGDTVQAAVVHVDNEDAVNAFWSVCENIKKKYQTSPGEAGYYQYDSYYRKVLAEIKEAMRIWKNKLSTKTYDPVSGKLIDVLDMFNDEDTLDRLYDLVDIYNTSSPVSGDWDTETKDEQEAIAEEFDISLEDAKGVMINILGFDEDLF